tara:strand:- start:333 stop:983 length:651 start_codon:yes stop_codon:yes gene_type:complete
MLPFVIKDDNVKQTMYIQESFPTPIGLMQMDKALNKKILAFIKSTDIKLDRNLGGNSVSIDENFLDNDELSDVKQLLTDSVNEYFKKAVNPNKDTKLYITISWLNVSENGESHHVHHHPNSIVSGVLYIDTHEEDTISFLNPQIDMFGNLIFSGKTNLLYDRIYPATTGKLIVFPSTLRHQVLPRPNTCKGKRLSLSFNTWIKGVIGSGRKDQLHL